MPSLPVCRTRQSAGLWMTVRNLWNGKSAGAIITTPSLWDPPSYGRGPKGEIWKIEEAVFPLIELCSQLLTERPLFFPGKFLYHRTAAGGARYMIATALKKYGGTVEADEIGLPVTAQRSGAACGAAGDLQGRSETRRKATLLSGCRSFCRCYCYNALLEAWYAIC